MNAVEPKNPTKMLLHVGYQKTGSTWLQRSVFDKGEYGFLPWSESGSEQPWRALWQADKLDYSVDELRCTYLEQLRGDIHGNAYVALSSECFVGGAMGGGYNSEWNARVLHRMFPNARVLIMIREQRSILLSIYAQYIKAGGRLPIDRYLNLPREGRLPSFSRSYYQYHKLVSFYRSLFGADRVLVLPYEMILNNPDDLVRRLQTFCEIDSVGPSVSSEIFNGSPNPFALTIMRSFNSFRRSNSLNNYSKLSSKAGGEIVDFLCRQAHRRPFEAIGGRQLRHWRSLVEELAADEYDESNRKLAEITRLPLADFGYLVAPSQSAVANSMSNRFRRQSDLDTRVSI